MAPELDRGRGLGSDVSFSETILLLEAPPLCSPPDPSLFPSACSWELPTGRWQIGSWNPGGSRGIPHPSVFLKNQEVGLQDLSTFWDSGLGHPKCGLWLMRCQLFSVCSPTSLLREPNAHSCPRHQFQRVWLEIKGYRTKTRFCSCPQTQNAASIVQRTEIELG